MKLLKNYSRFKEEMIIQLADVPFNTLFAQAVVEQKIRGDIFVDDNDCPETFYILHPYGMSLLMGKSDNIEFNNAFREYVLNTYRKRNKIEWMQAYSEDWHLVLENMFNNKIPLHVEVDTRVNFKLNKIKYLTSRLCNTDPYIKIIPTSKNDFNKMTGSVIPKFFWNNSEEFMANGAGYSLFYEESLAAMAFSSAVDSNTLELGIETIEQFRGKSFAYKVCSALIDYCLERGLEPVWACKLTNIGSYKLAQKLGFEEVLNTPYYKLNY